MAMNYSTRIFVLGVRSFFVRALVPVLMGWISLSVVSAQDRPFLPRIILPPTPEAREPIRLTEMTVDARIVGLNAEVTTTLTFLNPNKRQLEGELVFPMPEGAGVTGYALDIKGQMVDGVVVKKEKARVAFESEVRRGVDPGIVEQVAGNVFRTRVYPLPPEGTRRVRIRSVAPLSVDAKGDAAWSLPMPIGETIEKLSIKVEVSQGTVTPTIGGFGNLRFESFDNVWVAKTEVQGTKPGEDLWVALPKLPAQVASVQEASSGETYFSMSDLPAAAPAVAIKPPARLGIAWDASGSRAGEKHFKREMATLKELLAAWPETNVTLLVFRDRPEEARTFNGDRAALLQALDGLACDGGTDLSAVSDAVNKAGDVDEWLLFSDGLDTLSGRLPDFGNRRVTALVSQTVADRELLSQVCSGSGGQVVDLQNLEPTDAVAAIVHPPLRLTGVEGSGIADVQGVGQVVHGRASICGKLVGDAAEITLEYSNGFRSQPVKIAKAGAPKGNLLASVWAARRIRQLAVRAEDNEEELLSLGQRFGIVSPVTSLIVLENLDQYVRNDIEPPDSLPELQKQWAERKASQSKEQGDKTARKLNRLLAMWKTRVDWWEKQHAVKPDFKWKGNRDKTNDGERRNERLSVMEGAPAAHGRALGAAPGSPVAASAQGEAATASRTTVAGPSVGGSSGGGGKGEASDETSPAVASISIKPWDPATPYLRALKAANKEDRYTTYLKFRKDNPSNPAFFLDCADYFFREGERETAVRILTNLAELKLEEASLLRVLAWRFQQAAEFDRAIVLLRKVLKLRPEEPQSLRDLALALAERGKTNMKPDDLTEALALQKKLIMGDWSRFQEIELIGLEEMNALIAWIERQTWSKPPAIPEIDKRLLKNLDEDMRIVMSWDADATDVDLHVIEPSGEEAFYSHNRTQTGGMVSHDITQGYGPEEYTVRKAQPGTFKIYAHYYGSSQQKLIGPATITATVFSNFGRPSEKKEVLTLRLDKPREKVEIGKIRFEGEDKAAADESNPETSPPLSREDFSTLKPGMPQTEVIRLLGEPGEKTETKWTYHIGDRKYGVGFSKAGTVKSVVESLPGGAKMILVQ